jgi:hypothetical protein
MKNNTINIYDFDPQKKDSVVRAECEKLLKEIKFNLSKNKKLKVIVSENV